MRFCRTCTSIYSSGSGKRQLDEINRIRYELELMAVALAVETSPARPEPCGTAREIARNYSRRKKGDGTNH